MTRWTRETVAEALGKTKTMGAWDERAGAIIEALLAERNQLEAEVADLRAAVEPKTRLYRIAADAIPGAHAQIWVEAEGWTTDPARMGVRRQEDGPTGAVVVLPAEWLVPVTPPSIDDPAPGRWPSTRRPA